MWIEQVWGCGDSGTRVAQAKQKKMETKDAERAAKVSFLEQGLNFEAGEGKTDFWGKRMWFQKSCI